MFWALEQRKKRREAFRAQVTAEARTEMLAERRSKTHLRGDGESTADWLDRMARELEDSGKK